MKCETLLPMTLSLGLVLSGACNKKSSKDEARNETGPTQTEASPLPLGEATGTSTGTATSTEAPASPGETPAASGGSVDPGTTPVVVPEPAPQPEPAALDLNVKDSQFWVYSRGDEGLQFNTPWDETEGDAIIRDEASVPGYARDCLHAAQDLYRQLAASKDFQAKIHPLLAQKVTTDLTFLVVVTDSPDDSDELRRLDRDAYFWHWSDSSKKPVLSLNQFEKGTWVWEVVANPKSCTQPVVRDIGRYLDWTAKRLAEKEANG